ncbi:MAG TPA: ABC transporter permease [Solirubrobacteraceae bacterium]|jgi:peptide/nickel transport system permease protein|nr:ABC transporter permease [Solirubrobacteraceae bacterium]
MLGYIIRRLFVAVIVIIGVAAITFAILHYLSPTPAYIVLGSKASKLAVAIWDRQHGYNRSELAQFISYLGNIVHGNFGFSYKNNQSVTALFQEDGPISAYLSGAALVLSLIIAIPLGVAQAVKRNSPGDYAATAINFTLYSMPSFFLGLILIQIFALDLNIFPPGVSDDVTTIGAAITHPNQLFLPIITLTLLNVASYSRYMRSSTLDELAQDYIRLARAKGLSERVVLSRHLFRNASLSMITLVGLSIPYLVAGNLLIEVLFNINGLGLLFYNAIGNEDYNVMLAYTLLGALLTVLGNLFADVAIATADPRVRLD